MSDMDLAKSSLAKFLKETSYEIEPKLLQDYSRQFAVLGRLQEAGLGSIRVVRHREDKKDEKPKSRDDKKDDHSKTLSKDGLSIRKTVCLEKQNY